MVHDTILLRYNSNGKSTDGIIKINYSYNPNQQTLEYKYIDYSDKEIKNYVEENTSVLSKIYSHRQLQN